ncbi:hypothetical protein HHK36_031128 [Tetracentron sinense]|uniref:Amino acid transporter transmembrane domain-containing protein n=1 Tax=Tetracentron sinense TaxID=13715 RepID=A0A835D282_TETSI|nr:hypothetical protein HHK36_031128 [Tetracentron sinense]
MEDSLHYISQGPLVRFSFVRCSGNLLAHGLAKLALIQELDGEISLPNFPGLVAIAHNDILRSEASEMGEMVEVSSNPTPLRMGAAVPLSPGESPLLYSTAQNTQTPSASPMNETTVSMEEPLEEVSQLTKLAPQEAWLPITESRNGNAFFSAFHTLSSGLSYQALLLPLAFPVLGWTWGILCLALAFVWQMYTLWLLIELHEYVPGVRYSRYLQLAIATFGAKRGKLLALFPTMYLSGGTCVGLVTFGGGAMRLFFQIARVANPLTTVEYLLVFTCCAFLLAQLPNLNSLAGVSLIGAISGVGYCTLIWVVSVSKDRPMDVAYHPLKAKSEMPEICNFLNAFGIVALAFRGHNVVLEIQGTMPSNAKHPSRVPMWRGVRFAYLLIAMCLFPLATAGYGAYGNLIPTNGGLLGALMKYHEHGTSRFSLGLISLLVVISCLSSYQIYSIPFCDNMEFKYIMAKNRPCPRWLRSAFRALFGGIAFFIAVALPILVRLAGLIGAIAMPVTFAYPCFMWIVIKKPKKYSTMWYLNWGLGCLGMVMSFLLVVAAIWSLVQTGVQPHFFNPHSPVTAGKEKKE